MKQFNWARYWDSGYEVSSRGDKRFSATYATLADGRSIEEHYQCDLKGFNPGGSNWRAWKGRECRTKSREQLWQEYLGLWRTWAAAHPELMRTLRREVMEAGGLLTDQYASSEINQARALSMILNDAAASA